MLKKQSTQHCYLWKLISLLYLAATQVKISKNNFTKMKINWRLFCDVC